MEFERRHGQQTWHSENANLNRKNCSSQRPISPPGRGIHFQSQSNLADADFDNFIKHLCAVPYKQGGRTGIPPGTYFRMFFIAYFEGIDGQRGIAWRCARS